MLEKKITFDQHITEEGIIMVRQITRVLEDGKVLSKSYHRHTVTPKDNVDNEDDRTKIIVNAIYTPEFIAEYETKQKLENPIEPIM